MIYPKNIQVYQHQQVVELEQGGTLPEVEIAYHTFGKLNAAKDNVVWVFHALTANSDPTDWWKGVIGNNTLIDPEQHFIVCANVLGSFYGTTNPRSINPETGKQYGIDFPKFTVRDVVKIHHLLRQHLAISTIKLCIGGSFGGHQALEFVLMEPNIVQSLFVLATTARETAWSIAIHEAQRMAIETDPTWKDNSPKAGATGLKTARALGLISYRTIDAYVTTQTDDSPKLDQHKAASYVRYQGEKLEKRFHAHCYWHLSKCLDTHHLGRDRSSIEAALAQITIPTTIIGIKSDLLIPPSEQQFLAQHIPNANYYEIPSAFGHDGFLIEVKQINTILEQHLKLKL
ncbi:homoserine O-acetyltransferase family protein [Aureispira anguillae]|uniref:Homoserine O-acetyltransferase n=1 Tax=Aureispira anguillae TaxID=2864201 RepID=A0A915YHX8_9BACT|nr:homoserine O-acetyltransferase [Aureispira anguillae]BDS13324.1 homoserine O-acetyltransferase [Aureispira anguillae]